jgi:hypothetical protein
MEFPYKENVEDYLPEFMEALKTQLESDKERWGDTWKNRPKEGQEERTQQTFANYFDQFNNVGTPINWLKVAGNAMINWVREEEQRKQFESAREKIINID